MDMKHFFLLNLISLSISFNAFALCVTATQANLRATPSSKGKLVWTVGKYMPLLEVDQKGPWIQVKDLDGKRMWIYGSLVSDDIDCAVIKVSKSSLRRRPNSKAGKTPLMFAYKYAPFKKIERDGAWLHLQDNYGFKHWVYENNLWEPLEYTRVTY